jgi:hypothetical protein
VIEAASSQTSSTWRELQARARALSSAVARQHAAAEADALDGAEADAPELAARLAVQGRRGWWAELARERAQVRAQPRRRAAGARAVSQPLPLRPQNEESAAEPPAVRRDSRASRPTASPRRASVSRSGRMLALVAVDGRRGRCRQPRAQRVRTPNSSFPPPPVRPSRAGARCGPRCTHAQTRPGQLCFDMLARGVLLRCSTSVCRAHAVAALLDAPSASDRSSELGTYARA